MINIKIEKKDLWLLSAVIVFLLGVMYVVAYGGNQPSVMGHSVGEMDWIQPIPQDLAVNGSIRAIPRSSSTCNAAKEGAMYYDIEDNAIYICKNGAWSDFKGAQGPQGVQGIQGIQGIQGYRGPPGPNNDGQCSYYENFDGPCASCTGGWQLVDCLAWGDFYNQYSWLCCPPTWSG